MVLFRAILSKTLTTLYEKVYDLKRILVPPPLNGNW